MATVGTSGWAASLPVSKSMSAVMPMRSSCLACSPSSASSTLTVVTSLLFSARGATRLTRAGKR